MKLAIPASGPGVDGPVDDRFGRCACYVIVDVETGDWETVPNPGLNAGGGAGSRAARFLADQGVDAVVLGNVGPNAAMVLCAMGIAVYSGAEGTVNETLERYRHGDLTRIESPTVGSHHGARRGRRD